MFVKIEVPSDVVKLANKSDDKCEVIAAWLQSQCDTEVAIADQITEHNEGKARRKRLKTLGFDLSTSKRVICSQCEAIVVNGTPCHEHGCFNELP
jgi:hypothetical protein